jgi:hypothetical protein
MYCSLSAPHCNKKTYTVVTFPFLLSPPRGHMGWLFSPPLPPRYTGRRGGSAGYTPPSPLLLSPLGREQDSGLTVQCVYVSWICPLGQDRPTQLSL